MSTCGAWARFHEGDVQFDVECDRPSDHPLGEGEIATHSDPTYGLWDTIHGLYDRSLTPAESRLKR